MSSIENDHERESAEIPAEQTGVDTDAGSDTDATKALISEIGNKDVSEGPHHARSNSVKKPITFKAVSVTKNFLAKAGTVPTQANKGNGDKCRFTNRSWTRCTNSGSCVYGRHLWKRCSSCASASTGRKISKWSTGFSTEVNESSFEKWKWLRPGP